MDDPMGFAALEAPVAAVSSLVLSSTLQRLSDDDVVERSVVSERPHRVEYALTDRERALEPVVEAMAAVRARVRRESARELLADWRPLATTASLPEFA